MSAGFQAVQWNARKFVYDAILLGGVALFIGTFMTVGALRHPPADALRHRKQLPGQSSRRHPRSRGSGWRAVPCLRGIGTR